MYFRKTELEGIYRSLVCIAEGLTTSFKGKPQDKQGTGQSEWQ